MVCQRMGPPLRRVSVCALAEGSKKAVVELRTRQPFQSTEAHQALKIQQLLS